MNKTPERIAYESEKAMYEAGLKKAQQELDAVVGRLTSVGLVPTVKEVNLQPPSMGNYELLAEVRLARPLYQTLMRMEQEAIESEKREPTPEKEKAFALETHDGIGDLLPLEDWQSLRACGAIVPSDGCGYWATKEGFSYGHDCFLEKPEWATHVVWCNR